MDPAIVRFTIEQIFLSDATGLRSTTDARYHIVEADTVDTALAEFIRAEDATLLGSIQKYPGFQAVATARTDETVFTVNLLPGSDTFRRHS
jgi:hypothetical protein